MMNYSPFLPRQLSYDQVLYDIPGTWVPVVDLDQSKINTDVVGQNNNTYCIARCEPIYLGHEKLKTKMLWKGVEHWVEKQLTNNIYSMVPFSTNPNRNIDYVRTWEKNNKKYYQFVEVKKTSGHSKIPPFVISSSVAQNKALLESSWGDDSWIQVKPSIYAIVSVDYDKITRSFAYSLWIIPIRASDDFDVLKTSNYMNLFPIKIDTERHDEIKNSLRSVKKRLF
jgi:hypothetical protein